MQARLDRNPELMRTRRETVEHPFGTIKSWMGSTHFQMRTLEHVSTEMSLHVLAYNLKRVMQILGVKPLLEKIRELVKDLCRKSRLFSTFQALSAAIVGVKNDVQEKHRIYGAQLQCLKRPLMASTASLS